MKRLVALTIAGLAAFSICLTGKVSGLPKGCTVYGIVTCDGVPRQGVAVSDGAVIAVTDRKGRYFLNSDKHNGTVFVSIPGCTEVDVENGMPHFWEKLSDSLEAEEHNFSLKSVDNRRHTIIAVTDIHLANIFDDQPQFRDIFMPGLRAEVEKYRKLGIPVYCINAGDSSYDRYWFEDQYSIADFPGTLESNQFPVAMFATMGNHDNDGSTPPESADTDFDASAAYRSVMGPTHYSFNIGDVHYIMLDDVVYKNSPGRIDSYEGIAGMRDYDVYVTEDQMAWLRRDLELITDKSTPIVVTMHVPLLKYKGQKGKIVTKFKDSEGRSDERAREFSAAFRDFEQVHLITGHTHKNLTCHGADDTSRYPDIGNIIDHNITGVCGCWWQTVSHNGLSLAPDSGPSGFEVFPVDGRKLEWYFVSNDTGASRQFRVFDMNAVREYYRTNGEVRSFIRQYDCRTDYSQIEDNLLYVHVWAWEPGWKVSIRENGKELDVTQEEVENPQFTITYHLPRAAWDDNKNIRWQDRYNTAPKMPHFFVAKASEAESTVEVSVTDLFGHTWTEIVKRPKAFYKKML